MLVLEDNDDEDTTKSIEIEREEPAEGNDATKDTKKHSLKEENADFSGFEKMLTRHYQL